MFYNEGVVAKPQSKMTDFQREMLVSAERKTLGIFFNLIGQCATVINFIIVG